MLNILLFSTSIHKKNIILLEQLKEMLNRAVRLSLFCLLTLWSHNPPGVRVQTCCCGLVALQSASPRPSVPRVSRHRPACLSTLKTASCSGTLMKPETEEQGRLKLGLFTGSMHLSCFSKPTSLQSVHFHFYGAHTVQAGIINHFRDFLKAKKTKRSTLSVNHKFV